MSENWRKALEEADTSTRLGILRNISPFKAYIEKKRKEREVLSHLASLLSEHDNSYGRLNWKWDYLKKARTRQFLDGIRSILKKKED